jgi:undecaprenyl-diphosphatase
LQGDNNLEFAINILKGLESIRNPFLNVLFELITRLGEELVVFGVICIFYWCLHKETAYELGLSFFASGILVQGLKVTFCVERPVKIDSTLKPLGSVTDTATGYSFPSGHTQSATTLYGFFAFYFINVSVLPSNSRSSES